MEGTLRLPATEYIAERAFASCTGLTGAVLGSAKSIGVKAFIECTGLETLYLRGDDNTLSSSLVRELMAFGKDEPRSIHSTAVRD